MDAVTTTVLRPGSRVQFKSTDQDIGPVEATIIAVHLSAGDHVSYTVSWWNGRSRNESTVERTEIEALATTQLRTVGFHSDNARPAP